MRLIKMDNPREGQKVQCSKCFKMIPAQDAIADIDAPANTFYHPECCPTMTAKDRMYSRIAQHGDNLKVIFPLATDDPITLCKRLRRIEIKTNRLATDFCNGDIDGDAWDIEKDKAIESLDKILHFTKSGVPVKINSDPRGYALKIRDEYVREHNLNIYRDWGGYGILAPEFDGKV